MLEGKTKNGFKFAIDERILDDWRLLKFVALTESKDPSEQVRGASQLVELLLGDKEDDLMKFIAKKNGGFIPATAVTDIITEILTSVRELKNS